MKKILILISLFICIKSIGQDKIVNDTINVNAEKYPIVLIDCGSSSFSKAAILFTCDIANLKKYKQAFFQRVSGKEAEYTQFYILGYDKNISKNKLNNILSEYLRKIDSDRMSNNLSTMQIKYTVDKLHKPKPNLTYFPELKKDISKIENLHLNVNVDEMCQLSGVR